MRLPMLFRTSVFQLTLMYMAMFAVSVIALFGFIYWSTIGYLERQTNEVIEAEIGGLAEQFSRRNLPGLIDVINERAARDPERRSAYLLVENNADLTPVAGNLPYWPKEFNQPSTLVSFRLTTASGDEIPYRAYVQAVGPYRLLVGREVRELARINDVFRDAAFWGLGLTLGLALIGGMLMGRGAQRRTAQMARTTRQIIAGDLSQRVPLTGSHDEHEELAKNVNGMLDQIESLLAGIRHVGDSIAHDLRGPVTRLRTRLEILLEDPSPSRERVAECLEQADALLETFNALLRIARVESGVYRSAFARIDLAEIVTDVCELYQAAAEERKIRLACRTHTQASVFGDRELLAQALTNLLDNAIKYTPEGGRVNVDLVAIGGRVTVSVADSGPGIPLADRERVLARFSRLDQARSKPGNGLGLALVRAVAQQHDGKLTLRDNAPGLIVVLDLPAAAATAVPEPVSS
jgi:signal transduction histidine kinase